MKRSPKSFTHLDSAGAVRMVDIGAKAVTRRIAVAEGRLTCSPETIRLLRARGLPKGDVFTVAKIAGIQAAKMTSQLIPLCHPLAVNAVELTMAVRADGIVFRATTTTVGRTGVEMEALAAVAVAALTVYDMCKAVDQGMSIGGIRVLEKCKR